ncbi:MAG TPA: hypothetical protein VF265_01190 [Nevskiaceae bacterium]
MMSTRREPQAGNTEGPVDPVRSVGDVIARRGFPAGELLAQAAHMHRYQRALRDWAATSGGVAPNRVVIRGSTATVYVDSAAAATILRYQANELLHFLRQRCDSACVRLIVRIGAAPREPRDGGRQAGSL